jgi:hypothetical protein
MHANYVVVHLATVINEYMPIYIKHLVARCLNFINFERDSEFCMEDSFINATLKTLLVMCPPGMNYYFINNTHFCHCGHLDLERFE